MEFKTPYILLFIPFVIAFLIWHNKRALSSTIRFSSNQIVKGLTQSWKTRFSFVPFALRLSAVVLFLIALAGPRIVLEETKYTTEGIDIVLSVDSSGSMAAEDFTLKGKRVNRLAVVKDVVDEFVQARGSDKIGLIVFAAQAYVACPLTSDYEWLLNNLSRIEIGMLPDGTAVGSAIGSSLTRLKKSKAKSKVVILLTDGINNAGDVDPLTAARAAQALGVKIYTIGAGTKGFAPFPVKDFWGRTVYQKVQIDLDEKTLKEIANLTNAKYFRATDTDSLRKIYKEIDKLEKTEIEEQGYKEYREMFWIALCVGLSLLLLELILTNTVFLKIP